MKICELIEAQIKRMGTCSINGAWYNYRMTKTFWHKDEEFYFRRLKEEVRKERRYQKVGLLQVGNLVIAQFWGNLMVGTITKISDGSETKVPGELMYLVKSKTTDHSLWLHHWEISRKLKHEEIISDNLEELWAVVRGAQ
jgi:hypothetical protein